MCTYTVELHVLCVECDVLWVNVCTVVCGMCGVRVL